MKRRGRSSRWWAGGLFLLTVLLTGKAVAEGSVPGWNQLVYLVYRLEVAGYCSLVTERAGRGFRIREQAIIGAHGLDRTLVESARAEAWKLAYREWDNRGLGGFRRWCKNEGSSYVRYLEEISRSPCGSRGIGKRLEMDYSCGDMLQELHGNGGD